MASCTPGHGFKAPPSSSNAVELGTPLERCMVACVRVYALCRQGDPRAPTAPHPADACNGAHAECLASCDPGAIPTPAPVVVPTVAAAPTCPPCPPTINVVRTITRTRRVGDPVHF